MADLTPDLHIFLSWGLIAESFHSLQSLSVSGFHVIFGLPGPHFPWTCIWKAVLTAPLERSTCPYQRSLLSFRMRSRSSMPSCASSLMGLVVFGWKKSILIYSAWQWLILPGNRPRYFVQIVSNLHSILGKNFSVQYFEIFFLFFHEIGFWYFMQIVF